MSTDYLLGLDASHPSRGAWIEMLMYAISLKCPGRTPHGVRGLKLHSGHILGQAALSHPSRGAWIEIRLSRAAVWRGLSHPSRGAWIEMVCVVVKSGDTLVAPLTGCVD